MILPSPRGKLIAAAVATALLGGVIAVIVLAILPDEKADMAMDAQQEKAALMSARMAIQQRRPMAASITYGKTKVLLLGDAPVVCGEVDVQEPDDGMDGMARFTWVEDRLIMEEMDGTDALANSWRELCD